MSALFSFLILFTFYLPIQSGIPSPHFRTPRVKRDTCSCSTQYTPVNCRCNTDWQSGELLCRCDKAAVLSPSNCACSSGQLPQISSYPPPSAFPQSRSSGQLAGGLYAVPPSVHAQCQPACQQKCYQTCNNRPLPPPPLYPPPESYPYSLQPQQEQQPAGCPPGQCQSTCQRACSKMANPVPVPPSPPNDQCFCEPGDEDCQCSRGVGPQCYQLCANSCEDSCHQSSTMESPETCEASCHHQCLRNCGLIEGPMVQPPAKWQTPLSSIPPAFPPPPLTSPTRVGPQQALTIPQRHIPASSLYGNGVSIAKGAGGSHYLTSVSQQPQPNMASLVFPSSRAGQSQNSLAPINNNWRENSIDTVDGDGVDNNFLSGCLDRCPQSCERACSNLPGSTVTNCQPACVSMCGQSCQQHDNELLARRRMDALMDDINSFNSSTTAPKTENQRGKSTNSTAACAPLCQPECLKECTSKYMEEQHPAIIGVTQSPKRLNISNVHYLDIPQATPNSVRGSLNALSLSGLPATNPSLVDKKAMEEHIAQRNSLLDAVSKSLARMAILQRQVPADPTSHLKLPSSSKATERSTITPPTSGVMHAPPKLIEQTIPATKTNGSIFHHVAADALRPTASKELVQPSLVNRKLPNFFDEFLSRRRQSTVNKFHSRPMELNANLHPQQLFNATPTWEGAGNRERDDQPKLMGLPTPSPEYAAAIEKRKDRNWYMLSLLDNPSTHHSSGDHRLSANLSHYQTTKNVRLNDSDQIKRDLLVPPLSQSNSGELEEEEQPSTHTENLQNDTDTLFPQFTTAKITNNSIENEQPQHDEFRVERVKRGSPKITTIKPTTRPTGSTIKQARVSKKRPTDVTTARPPATITKKTKGFQLSATCHSVCRRMCGVACKPPRGKAKTADLHRNHAECSASCIKKCWAKCGRNES